MNYFICFQSTIFVSNLNLLFPIQEFCFQSTFNVSNLIFFVSNLILMFPMCCFQLCHFQKILLESKITITDIKQAFSGFCGVLDTSSAILGRKSIFEKIFFWPRHFWKIINTHSKFDFSKNVFVCYSASKILYFKTVWRNLSVNLNLVYYVLFQIWLDHLSKN